MAILDSLLVEAFSLDTTFGNIKTRGRRYAMDCLMLVGGICCLFAAAEAAKAVKSRDAGGLHWTKFVLGAVIGGMLMFWGGKGIKTMSGSNTFTDITGTTNLIMNVAANLPVHDLVYLLV